MDFSGILVAIGVVLFLALVAGVVIAVAFRSMWQVASPNEALIISGIRSKGDGPGYHIITGGGGFVWPGIQHASRLSLGLREATLNVQCNTKQGIQVGIQGVAVFKIGNDPVSIANAAQRFLGQSNDLITRNIQNLFDGHVRSIIGNMTVEELMSNRGALTDEVRKSTMDEMQVLGLVLDSLQIQEIEDPSKYIENLAIPHVATVKKNARIAQAQADQEAAIAESNAAALKADAARESEIKRAGYQAEIDKAKADAAQAGPLAAATAKQNVTRAETVTAQLNADLAEQNLQATVRKPADAEAYARAKHAEAERNATVFSAEAEAKRIELDATAQSNAIKITGQAQAAAIEAKGAAEGTAIRAKLLAEAEGIKARAEALATNQEGVIAQTIAENMAEIVKSAASAYNNVGTLTVLDGAQGMTRGLSTLAGMASTLAPVIKNAVASLRNAVKPPETIDHE